MIVLNGNWKEEIIKAFEDGEALRGYISKTKRHRSLQETLFS